VTLTCIYKRRFVDDFCAAGRQMFKTFLRSEYSEENMLFWIACEELKHESVPDVVEEKARSIYDDYISILSPKEVRTCFNYHTPLRRDDAFDRVCLFVCPVRSLSFESLDRITHTLVSGKPLNLLNRVVQFP